MTTAEHSAMDCGQFADSIDLYAIGLLDGADMEALRSHLAGGCALCAAAAAEAIRQAALISETAPLVEPPAYLRERIAASVRASKPVIVMQPKRSAARLAPWLVAAAAAAALVIGIGFEENDRHAEEAALQASLAASNADAQRMAQMLTILQAPGTRQVAFKINPSQLPQGSLFIHKNLGVAMVVAHLPAAPDGWKYESWIMPKTGAPQPVESFATNKAGVAITVVKGPVDVTQWSAMAVSMEPEKSTPVRPTKVVFASPV